MEKRKDVKQMLNLVLWILSSPNGNCHCWGLTLVVSEYENKYAFSVEKLLDVYYESTYLYN